MRIGLVVPHIFMHKDILPRVIFSPGRLALDLAAGLEKLGADVTLFSPGPVDTAVKNVTADLHYFEQELAGRGYGPMELLKKHPLVFVSMARQVQAEVIAKTFAMANKDELDVVHLYTNEEDVALPFIQFCKKPVVLTHHDPFSLQIKYKTVFPKYRHLNWISISMAQRQDMPPDTNWIANIYHGLDEARFKPNYAPRADYLAYFGRIIQAKGVHLAIAAVKQYNAAHPDKPYKLKIAGQHYAGHAKDGYWVEKILPHTGEQIEYVGFIKDNAAKQEFLGNAAGLLVPSVFNEPFGLVNIEALACGTPVIGLDSGAIPEIIEDGKTGFIVPTQPTDSMTAAAFVKAIQKLPNIQRQDCREAFKQQFTLEKMCTEHLYTYGTVTS